MQKPIDGIYKTRSAITKPTGKNRFDAGINGINKNAIPYSIKCVNKNIQIENHFHNVKTYSMK